VRTRRPADRCFMVITASFAFCPPTYKRFIHFNRMLIADSVALRAPVAPDRRGACGAIKTRFRSETDRVVVGIEEQMALASASSQGMRPRTTLITACAGFHNCSCGERHIDMAGAAP
jgi:hypothetical protein